MAEIPGEETHGVYDEIVHEPRGGNCEESNPVALDDQPVGNLGVLHRITLEPFGLVHIPSPKQDGKSRDGTETEGQTPYGPEVVWSKAMIKC